MPLHYLRIIAASSLGWVQQVSSATDCIHGTTQRVRITLVVIVTHDILHGLHINHLLYRYNLISVKKLGQIWRFC